MLLQTLRLYHGKHGKDRFTCLTTRSGMANITICYSKHNNMLWQTKQIIWKTLTIDYCKIKKGQIWHFWKTTLYCTNMTICYGKHFIMASTTIYYGSMQGPIWPVWDVCEVVFQRRRNLFQKFSHHINTGIWKIIIYSFKISIIVIIEFCC